MNAVLVPITAKLMRLLSLSVVDLVACAETPPTSEDLSKPIARISLLRLPLAEYHNEEHHLQSAQYLQLRLSTQHGRGRGRG